MSGPTKAQRAVLERMASGRWLIYSVHTQRWTDMGLPMVTATGHALLRRGWIRFAKWLEGESMYVITDLGRAALAAVAGEGRSDG